MDEGFGNADAGEAVEQGGRDDAESGGIGKSADVNRVTRQVG